MAGHDGWVFFDRSLVDAASALASATGNTAAIKSVGKDARYHRRVFAVPPWPEIFVKDDERQHDFAAAVEEYHRLAAHYAELGYEWTVIPKAPVQQRADFVLQTLPY